MESLKLSSQLYQGGFSFLPSKEVDSLNAKVSHKIRVEYKRAARETESKEIEQAAKQLNSRVSVSHKKRKAGAEGKGEEGEGEGNKEIQESILHAAVESKESGDAGSGQIERYISYAEAAGGRRTAWCLHQRSRVWRAEWRGPSGTRRGS